MEVLLSFGGNEKDLQFDDSASLEGLDGGNDTD